MGPVDTSRFQFGVLPETDPEFDPEKERRLLDELALEAKTSLERQMWAPPIEDLLLACGIGGILGLYLVRFRVPVTVRAGICRKEMWLLVGDMPTLCFTTDTSPTRAQALRTYCELAEQWAEAVLTGGDLSECHDMRVEPTAEHANMLKSRTEFIRRELIPEVEEAPYFSIGP